MSTENAGRFCDNRCDNKECAKHLSKLAGYRGCAVISRCGIRRIARVCVQMERQIKAEMREAGIE